MKYKLDGSYLNEIDQMVIDLNIAALTTYVFTRTALKVAYNNIELSKEQLELFEADLKASKYYKLWNYSEEEKTIKNYLKNLEIQKQLNKLSISEKLKFHIEQVKKMNDVMDLDLSESEIIEKANKRLNIKGGVC